MRSNRRLTCLLVCLIVSSAFCDAVVAAHTLWTRDPHTLTLARVLMGVLIFSFPTLVLSIPGLLIAILMALYFRDLRGRRFWLFLVLGSLTGPFSLTLCMLLLQWRQPDLGGWREVIQPALLWALSVSTLATILYLAAARFFAYMNQLIKMSKAEGAGGWPRSRL